MRLVNDIINKEILDDAGNILGKVKDIKINDSTYKIESIILVKETSTKIRSKATKEESIPFEMINHIGEKIILKNDLDNLII